MNNLMYYGRLAWTGLVDIHEGMGWTLEEPYHGLLLEFTPEYLLVSMLFGNVMLICNDMCYVQSSIYSTIYYTCWLAVMHELHSNIVGRLISRLSYEVCTT